MARRIVTGQSEDGTSCVLRDEVLEQDVRGVGSYRVWAADDLASLRLPILDAAVPLISAPTSEQTPEALRTAPPQPQRGGQWRVSLHEMQAGADGGEGSQPFLHWHNTFDLQWLISGALTVSLDSGDSLEMSPGDIVIQHGTNHAWQPGPDGAVMAIFMYGAERSGVEPPAGDLLNPARWVRQAEVAPAEGVSQDTLSLRSHVGELMRRDPRRIVTAQTADGRSVFAQAGAVAGRGSRNDGVTVHQLWSLGQLLPIKLPYLFDGAPPPPASGASGSGELSGVDNSDLVPGAFNVSLVKFDAAERGQQHGLRSQDTIDIQWLFAGELSLILDDGSEVRLEPGDAVVQNGTNHGWRVGAEGAVLAQVSLGVERDTRTP